MRICLVGRFSYPNEEGMTNISFNLYKELAKHDEILALDIWSSLSRGSRERIRQFGPEIVHYIHGPSAVSLFLLKILSSKAKDARTVVSASHPFFPCFSYRLVPLLRPDLVLVQSFVTEKVFRSLRCNTEVLPNGVDTKRFLPVSARRKQELREKYGIDRDKFIILHVGPIRRTRNIQSIRQLAVDGNQVLVVCGNKGGVEKQILQQLSEKGCIVWKTYFPKIEEIYALSDCYFFPTVEPVGCIEMPLSVLEAMSCNLPVISTRFGALPRFFDERNGFFFIDRFESSLALVEMIRAGVRTNTRGMVLPFSWEKLTLRLREMYKGIMG